MAYALGLKVIKRFCLDQTPLGWQRAKLTPVLFKPYEQAAFSWVDTYLHQHHMLPHVETLEAQFPDVQAVEVPEPVSYYLQQLENQYGYEQINQVNLETQALLKAHPDQHEQALGRLKETVQRLTSQRYRYRIVDVGQDVPDLVMTAYHHAFSAEGVGAFGWHYLDTQSGGIMPGDVISFVGRPAVGKTWLTLWTALHNWRVKGLNVLYASMEMMTLPIAQRIAAMYTGQNISQLKVSGYSHTTFKKFQTSLKAMTLEKAKFYVIDGNLAATVDDIFLLAEMLDCPVVVIDGAYLLRHKNLRLDRFLRAAENVELIKRQCTDLDIMAFCSWQFNREASKKQKKGTGDTGDLEDIGYTDAIGQISSIALSLYQEEGVETMKERKVRVMKGRNGEVGQFSIAWDFVLMQFHQTHPIVGQSPLVKNPDLQWI